MSQRRRRLAQGFLRGRFATRARMRGALAGLILAGLLAASPAGAAGAAQPLVLNPFTQQKSARPGTFPLAQDGSVGLTNLRWKDWGAATTRATGVDHYRLWPSPKYATVGGSIRLTGLTTCNGSSYYKHAVATVTVMVLRSGTWKHHRQTSSYDLLPTACR